MNQADAFEAVEKVLKEPVFAELPENAWKVRTNLLLISLVSIVVVMGDLHIDPDSQLLGLKFRGLSESILQQGLTIVVAYLLLHFFWASFDALLEWRVRVTGTRVAYVTTGVFASEYGDYPGDPRQSTLYHWWKEELPKIGNLGTRLGTIREGINELGDQLKGKTEAGQLSQFKTVVDELTELKHQISRTEATLLSQRIPASLKRFDSWYGLFLRSQNLRWLVVDIGVPLGVGASALFLLVTR